MSIQIKDYIIFLFVIFLITTSCEKDNELTKNENIVGEWLWIKSQGGFTGNDIQTPKENGIEKIIKFYENDTIEIFENNILVHKTDYFLSREKSMLLHDTFDFVTINYKYRISNPDSIITLPMRYIIWTLSDSLSLGEDVYDGYGHLYLRNN